MPAGLKAGPLLIRYLTLGDHVTYDVPRYTIMHARWARNEAIIDVGSLGTWNVRPHEAFDRRWSVCAWPRPSQCLGGLSREWSMPLHRRMRLKLLPEALV
jgi:hypothetical protein